MPEVTVHSGLLSRTKVHVEDSGRPGRPVVLIHGWPLSGASWQGQVPDLAQVGLRVVRYEDGTGSSASSSPRSSPPTEGSR